MNLKIVEITRKVNIENIPDISIDTIKTIKNIFTEIASLFFNTYEFFINECTEKSLQSLKNGLGRMSQIQKLIPKHYGLIIEIKEKDIDNYLSNKNIIFKLENKYFINISKVIGRNSDYLRYNILDPNGNYKSIFIHYYLKELHILFSSINILFSNNLNFSLIAGKDRQYWE